MESACAIQVAHIANMPNILTAAYYQLSRIGISQDTVSQLGRIEECSRGKGKSKRGDGKIDKGTVLSEEDLHRLAVGREKLSRYMLTFKKRLPKELVLHQSCADTWDTSTSVPVDSVDVLSDLLELCSVTVFPGVKMCPDCRWKINERGRGERARVWKMLPKLFRLPVRPRC